MSTSSADFNAQIIEEFHANHWYHNLKAPQLMHPVSPSRRR
jgi:hypothetical protein